MIPLILLLAELLGLYFLAQGLTQVFYDVCFLLFRSRTLAITIITLITFPGTVIHELSHLFTAEILGVHTGKLTLVPEGINEEEVKAGSVMISESDPFRRYLIGLAPLFTGLIFITALSYLLINPTVIPIILPELSIFNYQFSIISLLILYLLLAISNSMFSSKEDLKGFIPFAIALGAMIVAGYVAGLRIGITGVLLTFVTTLLDALTKSLAVVLVINLVGLIIMKGLMLLTQKITHRKLLRK